MTSAMSAVVGHVMVASCLWWSAAVLMTSWSVGGAEDTDFRSVRGGLRTMLEYSVQEEVEPGTLIGK